MLSLLTILALHVSQEYYFSCEDYVWLRNGILESEIFTESEKTKIIDKWKSHTEPSCFDSVDAND